MTDDHLLAVRDLTLERAKPAPGCAIVRGVGFALPPRRILGLVGASGCGKSLTCLAAMGLLPGGIRRAGGDIRLRGESLPDLPPIRRRALRGAQMAMILQNPMSCFDAVFSVRRHFRETLAAHNPVRGAAADARAREALAEVGFERPGGILDLYPFQMSGGMLQRVMIALALMMRVPLLIADEPTTDLDLVSQARVLNLLARMRADHGMAILLVTHDLSVIARLADDVAVMAQGAIVEAGSVAEVFGRPRQSYTQALMAAHRNLYDDRLTRLLDQVGGWKAAEPAPCRCWN